MNKSKYSLGNFVERTIPWLVLTLLLLFTYAKFFEHPYAGFRVNSDGYVLYIFVEQNAKPALELNDRLIQAGSLRWADFKSDYRKLIFENVQPGEIVLLTIQHAGEEITIPWKYPGPNRGEIADLLINEGWLAYVFWLCGTLALFSLRPRDERWRLMIAFNYLTAIWLTVGSGVSLYHIWGSPLILRMSIWFCIPVYLRFHWLFPRKLTAIPTFITLTCFTIPAILSILEWFQILPVNLYLYGFLIAVAGSLLFFIAHFIFQPDVRNDLRLIMFVTALAFLPAILIGVIAAFISIPGAAGVGLVGLPILPIAYLYGVYRRQLGGLEVRVNRFFSIYLFIILLGFMELPLLDALDQVAQISSEALVTSLLAMVLTAAAFIWVYPAFESFIERRFFGITLPSRQLLERYSTHITTSVSILDLTKVLHDEILSSLLIRQFAFLLSDRDNLKLLSILNVEENNLPKNADVPDLQTQAGGYLPPALGMKPPLDWIRLILPLKLGDETIGFWLFGRRDPDDLYAQAEIPILRSLANQTAVALSNILQTQQIKEMYEANILRQEQERLRLARDLHDSVLNELAALVIGSDAPVLSPKIQQTYEMVTERVREIVSDLRPPMLNYGLKLAFDGLADNLMERNLVSTQIAANITANGECRYAETVEINIYRIVQEACQNALRYAHAKHIQIVGTLSTNTIDIAVEDDGIGFVTETNLKLTEMIANKHFGLANMLERADLIGAEIKIDSSPGHGAKIRVLWEAK